MFESGEYNLLYSFFVILRKKNIRKNKITAIFYLIVITICINNANNFRLMISAKKAATTSTTVFTRTVSSSTATASCAT